LGPGGFEPGFVIHKPHNYLRYDRRTQFRVIPVEFKYHIIVIDIYTLIFM